MSTNNRDNKLQSGIHVSKIEKIPAALNKSPNGCENTLRLSSYGTARDLSLDGSGSLRASKLVNKKVYAPNLKVVRNRNVNTDLKSSNDNFKSKRYDKSKPDRNRNKAGSNLVQTCGLFSEGVGGTKRIPTYEKSSTSSASSKTTSTTYVNENKLSLEAELDKITDLLTENVIQHTNGFTPIKLKEGFGRSISATESTKKGHEGIDKSQNLKDLFESSSSGLLLFQIPFEKFMPNIEEGHIGKLVRYKSGVNKLILGSTQYDLIRGLDSDFLQEVMEITTNPKQRNGKMVTLGSIEQKICAFPDWHSLLNNS